MSREITEYCMTCLDSTGEYVEPTNYRATRDESLEWVWEWRGEHVQEHGGSTTFLIVERGEQRSVPGPLAGFAVGDVVTLDPFVYMVGRDRKFRITEFAAIGDQGFIAIFGDETNDPQSAYLDHLTKVGAAEVS